MKVLLMVILISSFMKIYDCNRNSLDDAIDKISTAKGSMVKCGSNLKPCSENEFCGIVNAYNAAGDLISAESRCTRYLENGVDCFSNTHMYNSVSLEARCGNGLECKDKGNTRVCEKGSSNSTAA